MADRQDVPSATGGADPSLTSTQGEGLQEASRMGGIGQQVKGNLEKAWGAVTGSELRKAEGERHIAEGKAEKHMARAEDAATKAMEQGAQAAWEEGKAEKKLGKVYGDIGMEAEGQLKKNVGKDIKEAMHRGG